MLLTWCSSPFGMCPSLLLPLHAHVGANSCCMRALRTQPPTRTCCRMRASYALAASDKPKQWILSGMVCLLKDKMRTCLRGPDFTIHAKDITLSTNAHLLVRSPSQMALPSQIHACRVPCLPIFARHLIFLLPELSALLTHQYSKICCFCAVIQ